MKIRIFTIFLFINLAIAEVPFDICEGVEIGFLPHPTDCSQFILCVWELPSLQQCRVGEIFNPQTLTCVPGNSDTCEVFTTTQAPPTLPTVPSVPTVPSLPTIPSLPTLPTRPNFATVTPTTTTPPQGGITTPSLPTLPTTTTIGIGTSPPPQTTPGLPTLPTLPGTTTPPPGPSFPTLPTLPGTTTPAPGPTLPTLPTLPQTTTTTVRPPTDPNICRNNQFRFVADPNCCYCYFWCLFDTPLPGQCDDDRIFVERLRGCVLGDQATCTPNFPNVNVTNRF